jgi:hypothetical protein
LRIGTHTFELAGLSVGGVGPLVMAFLLIACGSDVSPAAAEPTATRLAAAIPLGDALVLRICGPNTETADRIGNYIAGRSFRAVLTSRADGCADVHIDAGTQSNGFQRSDLSIDVAAADGSRHPLVLAIVSEGGTTRVRIGE